MKAALEASTEKKVLPTMALEELPLASKRMTEEEFEAWCEEDVAAEYQDTLPTILDVARDLSLLPIETS